MREAIQVGETWYIRADSNHTLSSTRSLKDGELFGVFDKAGDVLAHGGVHGLFLGATRFLSRFELTICGKRPLLLGSTVREGNDQLVVDLTNPDLELGDGLVLRRENMHLFRMRLLADGAWHERLIVESFESEPIDLEIGFDFRSDWADIFEIRGTPREQRGTPRPAEVEPTAVVLGYAGVDGVDRHTRIEFSDPPDELTDERACFRLHLEPGARHVVYVRIACREGGPPEALSGEDAHRRVFDAGRCARVEARAEACRIHSTSEAFDHWIARSVQDLQMLVTETEHGPYPYAGIPWYSTVFGRDGILTAFELLWWKPEVARGVLTYLAAEQADVSDAEHDAEPGKILHERRTGEMAATGEIPFGRYFGTVDATPLFVCLAGAYLQRTGDMELARALWPAIERALGWMERDGDADGDGFLEYARRGRTGLINQGWKDSYDSVMHADGRLADGPIALCEVQAYAFAAYREAARMALALGKPERAIELRDRSATLRERFEEAFWCEHLGTYALALDGEKRPCEVRSSNAAHCLAFGIVADRTRAERVAEQLADPTFFTGWGIRTLASSERRYNPMSYHNGTIWPHDNAVAAYGLARYGRQDMAVRVMSAMLDASRYLDLNRLPELFCGFPRREGRGPTLYPVSCAPQAWAAGAVFMLLQSCLGLGVDGRTQRVVLRNPQLPRALKEVRIEALPVGNASVDLVLVRHDATNVSVQVVRRTGHCQVLLER